MSFLFQPEIINQLLKQAQQMDLNTIAKKLVKRLSGEFSPVSSSNPDGATLKNEVFSLDKLIPFIANNAININGARIAYTTNEYDNLAQNEKDAANLIIGQDYVVPSRLIEYIKHLQTQATNTPVLRMATDRLVDQVNQRVQNSGLTKSTAPQQNIAFPSDMVLDQVEKKFIQGKPAINGSFTLFVKDFSNAQTFNAWLLSSPEAKVVKVRDNHLFEHDYSKMKDLNEGLSIIVGSLMLRAQRLRQLAKTTEEASKLDFYVQKLQSIGGNLPTSTQSNNNTSNKNNEQVSTEGNKDLNQLISLLPLTIQDVNLDRIYEFMRGLQGRFGGERAQRISSYMNYIDQKARQLKSLTLLQDSIYSINITPKQFAATLRNQQTPGRDYLAALDRLTEIVEYTRKAIAELYYATPQGELTDNARTSILAQIGRNQTDNSIYMRNISDLESLKNKVNQVIKVK